MMKTTNDIYREVYGVIVKDVHMNIYDMILENDGVDLWLWRTTWGNTVARVVGAATYDHTKRYYGNPKLLMDVYGMKDGSLKSELSEIPSAGTYKTWRWIDAPDWVNNVQLRSLNDPKIFDAINL